MLLALLILLLLAAAPATAVAQPADAGQARVAGDYIVTYERSVGDPGAATARRERSEGFRARFRYDEAIEGFAARLTDGQVARLREDPRVASVVADRPVRRASEVPFAGGTVPTGVRRLRAALDGFARGPSGVRVAVLDTGVDLAHPDLDVEHGADCVQGDGAAQDDAPDGHGTHVAGIIGARNDGSGVIGVAPGTRLVAVKVLPGTGSGSISELICGVDWVTATRRDGDPGNDVAVANMSLATDRGSSCGEGSGPLREAIRASTSAGVTYVVSAGNESTAFDQDCIEPAVFPEVLTVTGVSDTDGAPGGLGPGCRGADDSAAIYSNFAATSVGAAHTIAAPGSCIESTGIGGGTHTMSGTSMAAPHVAALAALCVGDQGQTAPCAGMTPAQVIDRLRATARDHNAADGAYGFEGDPGDPTAGRFFGYLAAPPPRDDEGPVLSVDAPGDESITNDTTPTVSGRAGAAPGDHAHVSAELFAGGVNAGGGRALGVSRSGGGWEAALPEPLADGAYVVRVEQSDARSNRARAVATFHVDTVAPTVALDGAPAGTVPPGDVTFSFSSEPGASFECSLDGAPYAACASPARYPAPAPGGHTFSVRAVDRAGNRSAAASHGFTVAAPPPPAAGGRPQAGRSAAAQAPRFPAKLQVARSRVLRADRELDVLAPITGRASGAVEVTFRAAGRTTRFEAPIDREGDRVRFRRRLPRAQARLGTGILTLRYPGNDRTRPQEVRLRAASRRAELDLDRPRLSGDRLVAQGTISRRARGVVRVQLDYVVDGTDRSLELTARIRDGRWKLDERLPAEVLGEIARRQGSLHSYTLFTGYLPERVRGEMRSYRILPPR